MTRQMTRLKKREMQTYAPHCCPHPRQAEVCVPFPLTFNAAAGNCGGVAPAVGGGSTSAMMMLTSSAIRRSFTAICGGWKEGVAEPQPSAPGTVIYH
jgi:hypothetical protein